MTTTDRSSTSFLLTLTYNASPIDQVVIAFCRSSGVRQRISIFNDEPIACRCSALRALNCCPDLITRVILDYLRVDRGLEVVLPFFSVLLFTDDVDCDCRKGRLEDSFRFLLGIKPRGFLRYFFLETLSCHLHLPVCYCPNLSNILKCEE